MANYKFDYKIHKNGEHIFTCKGIPEVVHKLNELYDNDFYTCYMLHNYFKKNSKHQHGFKSITIERELVN